jgi:hypothetical protein
MAIAVSCRPCSSWGRGPRRPRFLTVRRKSVTDSAAVEPPAAKEAGKKGLSQAEATVLAAAFNSAATLGGLLALANKVYEGFKELRSGVSQVIPKGIELGANAVKSQKAKDAALMVRLVLHAQIKVCSCNLYR